MSVANILKYIQAVMLILPLIEKIVTMIEGLFSKLGSGQGVAKKEASMEVAKAALDGAGLSVPDEVIGSLIDSVVGVKNQTGEFITPAPRAPPFGAVKEY